MFSVDSSEAGSMSVEDLVQTSVTVPSSGGVQPSHSGTIGSLCFDGSKARDFEKLTDLALTSTEFPGMPSRESLQCLVRTDSKMREGAFTEVYWSALCNERSMQRSLSTSGASDSLEFGDQLTTRQMQQRAAKRKTEGFHSKSTVAIVLDVNRIT